MYIEIKGIPGSGKTYLSEKIYINLEKNSIMQSKDIVMSRGLKKICTNIGILFKLRFSFLSIIFLFIFSKNDLKIKKNMFICLWKNLKKVYIYQKKYNNIENIIVDEGITHPITILENDKIEKYYEIIKKNKWLNKILNNTIFIINNCDINTCLERIYNRNQSIPYIFKNKSKDIVKNMLEEQYVKTLLQINKLKENQYNCYIFCQNQKIDILIDYLKIQLNNN